MEESLEFLIAGKESLSLGNFDLNNRPALLKLILLHIPNLMSPRELTSKNIGKQIHKRLQIIPPGWKVTDLIMIARKLHIENPHLEGSIQRLG